MGGKTSQEIVVSRSTATDLPSSVEIDVYTPFAQYIEKVYYSLTLDKLSQGSKDTLRRV